MVKANAYGHGIRSVGAALDGHVDLLGVCSIDEAMVLRSSGVRSPILLTQGAFEESELLLAAKEGFHLVFHNEEQLGWLDRQKLPAPLNSWIKINTGLSRLGFHREEAESVYLRLFKSIHTRKPVRIMSHFACADERAHPLNEAQIAAFQVFIKDKNSEYSLCNSAGVINFPQCAYDFVRPGISIYGVSPISGKVGSDFGLKPVMSVHSKIISIQKVKKNETIGYGARYRFTQDARVGIVAFGYGDGYPLTTTDGTPVLVNNRECHLVGRVSMDMLAVDLSNCPNAKIGDDVLLWGESLPIERVCASSSTHVWNTLSGVQNRVKFLWKG